MTETVVMNYKKVAAVAVGVIAVGAAAGMTYWIIKKRRANKSKTKSEEVTVNKTPETSEK